MVETAPELGPDGEPYFAVAPPRRKPVWPWVVGIVVLLFVLFTAAAYVAYKDDRGFGMGVGDAKSLREFDPEFPSTALVEGLVDEPIELPMAEGLKEPYVALLPDPDGKPTLLHGHAGKYEWWLDPRARSGRQFSTEMPLQRIVSTGLRETPYVGVLRGSPPMFSSTVAGLAPDGSTRWSWRGEEKSGSPWLAPAFREGGAYDGCVVGWGGKDGIVGLSVDGTVAWRRPKRHSMDVVSTHRSLPRWVASATGDLVIERTDPGTTEEGFPPDLSGALSGKNPFITSVVLIPTGAGEPSVVCAGSVEPPRHEEPLLARIDAIPGGAKATWRSRPATEPHALTLLEAPGRPRLFVVTTKGGELLFVDESGSLRGRVTMPHSKPGRRNATYSLSAGPLGAGWAVVVRLLDGTYVYRVHPEKLPAK